MSWSASISGHVDTVEEEEAVVYALRQALKTVPGVNYAWAGTQFMEQVNLLAPGDVSQKVKTADEDTPHTPEGDQEQPVPENEPAEPVGDGVERVRKRPASQNTLKRAPKRPIKGR